MASIARKLYLRQGIGIGAFRKIYGSSKNNGTCKSHFQTCAGGHIRHMLKQLEKLKVIEKHANGGRKITRTGQRDLDAVALSVKKA